MVDNLYELSRSDKQLSVQKKVTARWIDSGYNYSGLAEITKLTRETVTVKLLENVGTQGQFRKGTQVQVARFSDQTRWSPRNCVQLVKV